MAKQPIKADFGELDEDSSPKYLLDRSYSAACRLNLHTYLWKESLQFNLHPSIPIPKDAAIVDVPAGTGSWLIDVSRELPSAKLDGFDIDLSQAPHPKWLPKNITMRRLDLFEELPQDVIGKYDIVHVRLLVLAMKEQDLPGIIKKFHAMLKPGGYLQWDDLNSIDIHIRKVEPDLETPALDQLKEMCYSNSRHDWVLEIPSRMAEIGFTNTSMHHYTDPPEFNKVVTEQRLMTMEEFAGTLNRAGKKDAANEFYKTINGAYQESVKGAALCIPRVTSIGCKMN